MIKLLSKKTILMEKEKASKCEALRNGYINLAWLIVTLVIHRPPLGVWLFLILISLWLLKIVYDSGLVVIIDVFFMILIRIWLFMIVCDSASLLIFSSMTLLGIWSLIIVFASPVVLLTNPALRPS